MPGRRLSLELPSEVLFERLDQVLACSTPDVIRVARGLAGVWQPGVEDFEDFFKSHDRASLMRRANDVETPSSSCR